MSGLVIFELKKPGVPARATFDEGLAHCKQQILAVIWFNALLTTSIGADTFLRALWFRPA